MNVEPNKVLVRRFYEEACDQGRLDIIDELFGDDYGRHDLRPADPLPGDRVYAGAAPE
jgi:hypothetical protein